MSGTITLPPVPAITIDGNGVTAPTFADLTNYATAAAQAIFGPDIYIANDSQDGQLLGIFAAAWNTTNDAVVAAIASFSPASAQGAALSSVVKVNGIRRLVPSNSTVSVICGGQVNTVITNGQVGDQTVGLWNLPQSVTIEAAGTVVVAATAAEQGAVQAIPNSITAIATPTYGWQTVTNPAAAVPGAPVESDGALRVRQQQSTALPAQSILGALQGVLEALANVSAVRLYENQGSVVDANGVPPHSIAAVLIGGDPVQIATAIQAEKGPGSGTYGTTTESVTDAATGISYAINFFYATPVPITVTVQVYALGGYSTAIAAEIQAAVAAAINAVGIGNNVSYTRLYVPAQLAGPYAAPAQPTDASTFELVSVLIARSGAPAAADVTIAFDEVATCVVSAVTVTTV